MQTLLATVLATVLESALVLATVLATVVATVLASAWCLALLAATVEDHQLHLRFLAGTIPIHSVGGLVLLDHVVSVACWLEGQPRLEL